MVYAGLTPMNHNTGRRGSPEFLRETIKLVRQIESAFIELGYRLYSIRTNEIWKGHNYDTFKDFLSEAGIKASLATILITVYETYVINEGIDPVKLRGLPYTSLYEAIPLIERDGVESVVAKVKLLTRSEIKDEVREEKHGTCEHTELIQICAECKKRIYEAK